MALCVRAGRCDFSRDKTSCNEKKKKDFFVKVESRRHVNFFSEVNFHSPDKLSLYCNLPYFCCGLKLCLLIVLLLIYGYMQKYADHQKTECVYELYINT